MFNAKQQQQQQQEKLKQNTTKANNLQNFIAFQFQKIISIYLNLIRKKKPNKTKQLQQMQCKKILLLL